HPKAERLASLPRMFPKKMQ
ncbi:hypothetical protein D031_3810B, partial [Vibrio parahaemolyticus VP-48]